MRGDGGLGVVVVVASWAGVQVFAACGVRLLGDGWRWEMGGVVSLR